MRRMVIYLGADHRGYKLKEKFAEILKEKGYPVFDMGAHGYEEGDDYPDYAALVAEKVSSMPADGTGVLVCGSGAGVCITANKFKNVRAVLAITAEQARAARADDHTNIICFASDYIKDAEAEKILLGWLATPFSEEERHLRRLEKIAKFEK